MMTNPEFIKRSTLVSGKEYASLLETLKKRYRSAQIKASVQVNTYLLEFYWDLGREISNLHTDSRWGSAFFDCLSLDLKALFPKQSGFSVTNLKYAKRWFDFYNKRDTTNRQRPVDEIQMPVDFGLIP